MKLSFDWLGDFICLDGISPQTLADKLTMGAFEVEEVQINGPDITGSIVVGEILAINPHPNADKIRLTKILIKKGQEPREIVCGAWNIEVGQKIPVALPGSCVINRHDGSPLAIKESKIRGSLSQGMLCSAPELGLTGNGEGILILDKDTPIGIDTKELLHLKKDHILIVEPRSNRPDALSVLGLAREVSVLLGKPLTLPDWENEFADFEQKAEKASLAISIENQEDCPFFSTRILKNLKIGASPYKIARRLEAVGVRCVNNVVDITNYVLHELGQPLHAYDLSILAGPALHVRRAAKGEVITTIDNKERQLLSEVLVITDASKVVGLAGIMGGKNSEINNNSTSIALEAAAFTSARIRRACRLLGLTSDSSMRFERGVDPASVRYASNRAAYLLIKHCEGQLSTLFTAGSDKPENVSVKLRLSQLTRIAEIDLPLNTIVSMLEPLGFKCRIPSNNGSNADTINIHIPSFRLKDIQREIDIIEEICRLYGYDRILPSMPKSTIPALLPDTLIPRIRHYLSACGLSEAWISSLVSAEGLDGHSEKTIPNTAVAVLNPLSPEHQVLRQNLLPGLMNACAYNQDHGQQAPWLFELGKVYFYHGDKKEASEIPKSKSTSTIEELMTSGIIIGEPQSEQWHIAPDDKQSDSKEFFTIKGIVEELLSGLNIPLSSILFERPNHKLNWFHPGRYCCIFALLPQNTTSSTYQKTKKIGDHVYIELGCLGEIHPKITNTYKLKGRAAAFTLSIESLRLAQHKTIMQDIFLTPQVIRDITVDIEKEIPHHTVEDLIRSSGGELLCSIKVVSIYLLSDNIRSLSYRLTFQEANKTLTALQVDNLVAKIRQELSQKLKASFRL